MDTDLDTLKRLLGLLTANGVTHFKQGDLEMRLEVVGATVPPQSQDPSVQPDQYTALMGRKARFPGAE